MPNKYADRLPFSSRGQFVVTKPMRFGSRTWGVGEDFPHRKMSIDQRRLRVLYDGKFLAMKGDQVTNDEPDAEEELELIAGDGQFIYDPELHTIEHEDNEYWIADEESYLVRVRAPAGKKLDTIVEKTIVEADDILAWGEED